MVNDQEPSGIREIPNIIQELVDEAKALDLLGPKPVRREGEDS